MPPIRIGNNIASLSAQRRVAENSASLEVSLQRLSSGMRINKASDDAAGLSIALQLRANSRVFTQAIRNVNDGISLIGTSEGAVQALTQISMRQLELAEQASNGAYSAIQRHSLDKEANYLVDEYNRIVSSVDFNGVRMLSGDISELRIQAGYGVDGSIGVDLLSGFARTAGTGSFDPQMSFAAGTAPSAIATGDLNGDGRADIVISNGADNNISVLLAQAAGGFAAAVNFATSAGPSAVSLSDVNRDGILDIVAANNGSGTGNTISTLLGNGNGSFRAAVNSSVLTAPVLPLMEMELSM